jgi:hypothetical protein
MHRNHRLILLASAGAALMGGATLALAETASPDSAGILSLQGENSSISSAKVTDRYYTNGIHVGWTSPEGYAPALAGLGRSVMGEGAQRVSISIDQQIYTPFDTASANPPATDRPYAGLLLATIGQSVETATSRGTLGFTLGVLGPSALGEEVQNGFHDLIGQKGNKGWKSQLRDEAVFGFSSQHVWRVPVGSVLGLEADAVPGAAASIGTLRIAVDAGFNLRLGSGLDRDFGAPRIRALGGGDALRGGDGVAWYVFAGAGGQAVARDVTLDGSTFRNVSRSVKLDPLVGQMQGGAALLVYGTRLTYTHVVQTQEFKHQKGGLHQFGSLALSVRF